MSLASPVRRNEPSTRSWESSELSAKRPSMHALEHVDLEDALAGERTLAKDVLVGVGDRAGVRVDAGRSGVQRGETAALRTRQRHSHARLDQAVAARHARVARTPARSVQGVRDRRDELARSVARQDRVGVQRDDERARLPERLFTELGGEARSVAPRISRTSSSSAPRLRSQPIHRFSDSLSLRSRTSRWNGRTPCSAS